MLELLQPLLHFGSAAAEEPSGIAALGIDPWAILAQAGTFLLLFFIVKKFALEKIVSTLEKRRKTIEDGVLLGREMEVEKAKLDEKVEATMHKTRQEADKIISAAHEDANEIMQKAQATAQEKTESMLRDARRKIDEEIMVAKKDLEQEIREYVASATEIIIHEKLDAKKDAALIDKALRSAR